MRGLGGGHRGSGQPDHHVSAADQAEPPAQKKRLIASERDEIARAAWRRAAAALNPHSLIFLDETSTHTALTRGRARAPRGVRAVGAAPRNHGPNISLLAALSPTGIGPSVAIEGAVDRPVFETYIAEFLIPTLHPGQTVILDNLSVHKGERIRHLIEEAGCHLLFLPAYSPDFNPIELAFAKLKTRLRQVAARTSATLVAALGAALAAITPTDARGFFAHCGFPLSDQLL